MKYAVACIAMVVIIAIVFQGKQTIQDASVIIDDDQKVLVVEQDEEIVQEKAPLFVPPISDALARVTKKPFGIYVSPASSTVSPERFAGYHTGVDFEAIEEGASIIAICTGPVMTKRVASGYGGVLVQRCTLEDEPITVIYGHLNIKTIDATIGDVLIQGAMIGMLGKGYSKETDYERKHLHLAIHRGDDLTLKGYVESVSELADWVDIRKYLQ